MGGLRLSVTCDFLLWAPKLLCCSGLFHHKFTPSGGPWPSRLLGNFYRVSRTFFPSAAVHITLSSCALPTPPWPHPQTASIPPPGTWWESCFSSPADSVLSPSPSLHPFCSALCYIESILLGSDPINYCLSLVFSFSSSLYTEFALSLCKHAHIFMSFK